MGEGRERTRHDGKRVLKNAVRKVKSVRLIQNNEEQVAKTDLNLTASILCEQVEVQYESFRS